MRASPPFLAIVFAALATAVGPEARAQTFRQWLGGQEVGGSSQETKQDGNTREVRSREWMLLSRLGQEIRQEVGQTARKSPDGRLAFTWRVELSSEPFEGKAEWSPTRPEILILQPVNGAVIQKSVPSGAILWPEEFDARLKEAARTRQPMRATTFSFPLQQWSSLELTPQGPAPLLGFPDAIRFTGREQEGSASLPVEVWVSPAVGELRHRTEMGGLELLSQRSELPPPALNKASVEGFFEKTLQSLPPHPFQPWLPEITLRAEGARPELPEEQQQRRLSDGRWQLRRAAPPTAVEMAQPPTTSTPHPEEARYLAPSSLVPFQDPAFDGLIRRMALPPGLSRWELARRVNAFVFEWITEKDFTVGFASALEVCRHPRGDCTEHGVLAVALLRKLGVPARGVTGWVGLGEMLGLHFWVEVKLKDRWIPIDPTFDQAPASAFRIKLGDTDLADLGSVGWEGAALAFSGVKWIPEPGAQPSITGDRITGPGGIQLRLPGGSWNLERGVMKLRTSKAGPWRIQAAIRPSEAQLRGAMRLAGPRSLRKGWWLAGSRSLWIDLGDGRWIQMDDVPEGDAYTLLDQLMAPASSS